MLPRKVPDCNSNDKGVGLALVSSFVNHGVCLCIYHTYRWVSIMISFSRGMSFLKGLFTNNNSLGKRDMPKMSLHDKSIKKLKKKKKILTKL